MTEFSMCGVTARNVFYRYCKLCRPLRAGIPDVYWDGKPEENLADDPVTGKPRVFISKEHKAAYLKERGLVEAGDRVHGAPMSLTNQSQKKDNSREDVKRALHHVSQMGRDVRKQEYLRIIKEGRKYA